MSYRFYLGLYILCKNADAKWNLFFSATFFTSLRFIIIIIVIETTISTDCRCIAFDTETNQPTSIHFGTLDSYAALHCVEFKYKRNLRFETVTEMIEVLMLAALKESHPWALQIFWRRKNGKKIANYKSLGPEYAKYFEKKNIQQQQPTIQIANEFPLTIVQVCCVFRVQDSRSSFSICFLESIFH